MDAAVWKISQVDATLSSPLLVPDHASLESSKGESGLEKLMPPFQQAKSRGPVGSAPALTHTAGRDHTWRGALKSREGTGNQEIIHPWGTRAVLAKLRYVYVDGTIGVI